MRLGSAGAVAARGADRQIGRLFARYTQFRSTGHVICACYLFFGGCAWLVSRSKDGGWRERVRGFWKYQLAQENKAETSCSV